MSQNVYENSINLTFTNNEMWFGGVPYYGKLIDIIELNYHGQFSVICSNVHEPIQLLIEEL